jgi:NADH-quinone oxidoreductase subunit M
VLVPAQGGWVGELTITNVGPEPLIVSRVALRGDDDDVRSPSRLSVRFVDGAATSATLVPGGSREVVVSWMPDKDPRVRQAFGHVVVTSTDEQAGEVAMGFRAQLPTGLGWIGEHALSLLVLSPLAVAALAVASWLAGRRDRPWVRQTAVAAAVLELVLALWAYRRFAPGVGRADGNDGFQLIERAVWVRSAGTEWYLGVDGTSMPLVLLAAAVSLVALLATDAERRHAGYYAALALLSSGVMGSLVALDLVVLFGAWQVVLLALVLLVAGWGGRRGELAAAKLAAYGAIGSGAMLLAFVALSRASGRTFLVDGASVSHTMSVPELARTAFAAKGAILGVPYVQLTWVLLFVAVAVATPVVPLHGWLPDALREAPTGAGVVIGAGVVALGPYLLVRVGLGAIPEGARWAGPFIAATGAFGALWAALCAMAQRDLRGFVAHATVATGGTCLFGVGALTAQGIAGATTLLFAHGLAAALLLSVAAALGQRAHTHDAARLRGLATETPALAALAAVALGVSMGVPGLVGSWGLLLALVGGFVRHPVLALLVVTALVTSAAAHLRIARLVLLGHVDAALRRSGQLAPFGGHIPDAMPRELLTLVPLAVLAVLLGLWPGPLLSSIAVASRDASVVVDPEGPDPMADGR